MDAAEPEQVIELFCQLFNAGDLDGLVNELYEEALCSSRRRGDTGVR